MKTMIWTAKYTNLNEDIIVTVYNGNLSNCNLIWKRYFGASKGFEPLPSPVCIYSTVFRSSLHHDHSVTLERLIRLNIRALFMKRICVLILYVWTHNCTLRKIIVLQNSCRAVLTCTKMGTNINFLLLQYQYIIKRKGYEINKMITSEKMLWSCIKFSQLIL